jgi:hypothetical protein
MDPYIEACGLWEDFHSHLIEKIYESLSDALPDDYLARTGERSYVVFLRSHGEERRRIVPDAKVTVRRSRGKPRTKGSVAVAKRNGAIKPVPMRAFIEAEHRETFVEIYEADPKQRLVTCIEVLSPSNKRPGTPGWEQYLRKREALLLGKVNLVEIDLLRGGQRIPMLDDWPEDPFHILVSRPNPELVCQVWSVPLQQPLPRIHVPLAKPDPDLLLDLQPLITAIYQRSKYERSIDYTKPLVPPLAQEVAAWMKQLLKRRGKAAKR